VTNRDNRLPGDVVDELQDQVRRNSQRKEDLTVLFPDPVAPIMLRNRMSEVFCMHKSRRNLRNNNVMIFVIGLSARHGVSSNLELGYHSE
jgi:hypothetical protein